MLRPQQNGFEIELIGEIVAMVALGQEARNSKAKKAVLDDRTACSANVVAGACNRLNLLYVVRGLPRPS